MAYTGMWLSNALANNGHTAVHQVDPAHADVTTAPGVYQSVTYTAPPSDPVGALSEYPGQEWVVVTSGQVLDQTPEDHQDGSVKGVYEINEGGYVSQAQASGAAHTEDYGASRTRNHAQPGLQFARERYLGERFSVPLQTATTPVALQRGLNGLDENNPDGFPLGQDYVPWVDRKFEIGQRFHDAHVAEVNTAKVIRDQPVPAGASQYNSPFALLARAITRPVQPMIRRDPPPMSAPIVSDGSETLYAAQTEWVVR